MMDMNFLLDNLLGLCKLSLNSDANDSCSWQQDFLPIRITLAYPLDMKLIIYN